MLLSRSNDTVVYAMATLDVGLIVVLVEQIWDLSVLVIPFLFIGFFLLYLVQRNVDSFASLAISSQRDMALHYSGYVLIGIALGGVVQILASNSYMGAFAAAVPIVYGVLQQDLPDPTILQPATITDYAHFTWIAVPFLAVLAIVAGNILLQSVVALIFYSTIFWEL